jgi:hypothetical protein
LRSTSRHTSKKSHFTCFCLRRPVQFHFHARNPMKV